MTGPLSPPLREPASTSREVVDGVKWRMQEAAAKSLYAGRAFDVRALTRSQEAQAIEDAPERAVFRVRLPGPEPIGRDLEVTIFRRTGLWDVFRSSFHHARSMRAWRAAEALHREGIPSRSVLAAGAQRMLGLVRKDLLLAEPSDAMPLREFLDSLGADERARFARFVAPVFAEMVHRLHACGLSYDVFDAEAVRVRQSADGSRRLELDGLDGLRTGGVAPLGRRLDNLAQLAASLDGISRTDRRRFWKRYASAVDYLSERERAYARLVESHADTLRRARWKRMERESLGNNTRFKRVRAKHWRGYAVRARMELAREVFNRVPLGGMTMPDAVVIKDSPESRILEQPIDYGAGVTKAMVKHKRRVGVLGVLRTFCRQVGAKRAWRTLWAMRVRGVPVEQPLAAFQRRCCGLTLESVLVTRKVEGAENLYRFAEARLGTMSLRERRALTRAAARLARRLHDAGFASRDLKAPNILVQSEAAGGTAAPVLTLVDVEGAERCGEVPWRIRARDLGRLASDFVRMPGARRTDFARFLNEYLAGRGVSRAEKRAWVDAIGRRVREKLAAWDAKRS